MEFVLIIYRIVRGDIEKERKNQDVLLKEMRSQSQTAVSQKSSQSKKTNL